MANLIVRGIDEALVRTLKQRAAANGRSAEAEHREILASALRRPCKRSFAEILAAIPDVGIDADFSDTSVQKVLAKMAHPENCVVKPGYFPETAQGVEGKFCFVSLDTDLYEPTIAGLRFFWSRLSPGGAIFVHDCNNSNYKGIRQAVSEFSAQAGVHWLPMSDRCGTAVFFKSQNA